jgi:hypothetical protein
VRNEPANDRSFPHPDQWQPRLRLSGTYLGGSGNEITGGIAYDPIRDRLLLSAPRS